jgi:quercetin dioxygenase-like cupin family protein
MRKPLIPYWERRRVMRRIIVPVILALVVAALALVVGAALATTPKGVTPTPLTRATLGKFEAENNGIEVESQRTSADFALAKVVIEPGGTTGWHHHPGVALVSVNSGAITEYDKNCHKSVVKAGEGFFESNGEVHVVRNRGKANAVLYVTFIAPTKTPADGLVILDPKPKGCNVK